MPFISDRVLDLGLNVLDTEANRLDICKAEPTTYAQAIAATHTVGNKTALNIGAPAARTPNGRQVTVAAIADGAVTTTSTGTTDDAEFWAITDTVNSRLLATGTIPAPQLVYVANGFTLAAFDIGIPGAV